MEQHRPGRGDFDGDRNRDQLRRQEQQRGTRDSDVEKPLTPGSGWLTACPSVRTPASIGAAAHVAFDRPNRYEAALLPELRYIVLIKVLIKTGRDCGDHSSRPHPWNIANGTQRVSAKAKPPDCDQTFATATADRPKHASIKTQIDLASPTLFSEIHERNGAAKR
jgi:hypothetical protein